MLRAHLVIFLTFCTSLVLTTPPLVLRDANTTRYSNIYMPYNQSDFFRADLFWVDFFIGPVLSVKERKPQDDLCYTTDIRLQQKYSHRWNNISTTACADYFCGVDAPFLLAMGKNESLSQNDRNGYLDTHMLIHTYCTLCNQTKQENFTNSTCPWFEKDYCLPSCSSASLCVFYQYKRPLCYDWSDNMYYRWYWAGSVGAYWFYFIAMPIIYIVESIVSILFVFLVLGLPEAKEIITRYRELGKATAWTKCRSLLPIRYQCIILLLIGPIVSLLCSIFDLFGLFIIRFYILSTFVRAAVILITNGNIIVLWKHICEMADDMPGSERNPPLSRKNIMGMSVFYSLSAIFAFCGALFYALYTFVDASQRVFWVYCIGAWIWMMTFIFFVVVIVLNVYSLKLWRLYNRSQQNQMNFLKLKVGIDKISQFSSQDWSFLCQLGCWVCRHT
jgi:hypothetical protein